MVKHVNAVLIDSLQVKDRPISISFQVSDVDQIFKVLKNYGVKVEQEPVDRPYGRLASIRDPDGNIVYLHKYPERN